MYEEKIKTAENSEIKEALIKTSEFILNLGVIEQVNFFSDLRKTVLVNREDRVSQINADIARSQELIKEILNGNEYIARIS